MKHTLALLTALILAPLAALKAADAPVVFHVSPQGRDSDPGTENQPLATIQAGVNQLQPGDTLLVHAGGAVAPVTRFLGQLTRRSPPNNCYWRKKASLPQ